MLPRTFVVICGLPVDTGVPADEAEVEVSPVALPWRCRFVGRPAPPPPPPPAPPPPAFGLLVIESDMSGMSRLFLRGFEPAVVGDVEEVFVRVDPVSLLLFVVGVRGVVVVVVVVE